MEFIGTIFALIFICAVAPYALGLLLAILPFAIVVYILMFICELFSNAKKNNSNTATRSNSGETLVSHDTNTLVPYQKETKKKNEKTDMERDVLRTVLKYGPVFSNNPEHIYLMFLEQYPNYRGDKNQKEIMTYINKYTK